MRRAVRTTAPVIIMDEAVGDRFAVPGDDLERLMYGFSLFVCLPDSMSHQPSVAPARSCARHAAGLRAEAGFADLEVLPIEDFGFWRFYSLTR